MVKKIFGLFNKEINGLHQAAYLLGLFAFLSQLLALLRDRVLAASFGTNHILDIYYSSFEIPDFIFATVASIVSISVLVPFITTRIEKSNEEAKKFINSIFSIFSVIIFSVSIVAFFLAPYIAPKIFPGIGDKIILIKMTRILLLSPIFLGFSNFVASITQVGRRFLIYALSPLFYNIGIIFGATVLYRYIGVYGLACGVILGAMMHLGIQLPFVFRSGLFQVWPLNFHLNEVKKVFLISIPRTLTLGMNQIITLVLLGMASLMHEGSIAIFNFSQNLETVPLSIIGVSYSLAAFPVLSQFISRNQKPEFLAHITSAIKHVIFWSLPISILFIVLRAQIVRSIYGAGNFGWTGTKLTAAALAIFAISVTAQALTLIFIRGYYAMGDTKKSLYISVVSGALSVLLSYGFVKLFAWSQFFKFFIESMFRVDNLPGTDVLMLALGFSLAQIVNCILLWVYFERENSGFSKTIWKTLFQSFSASIVMGFASYEILNIASDFFNLETFWGIFLQGLIAGVIGLLVLFSVLRSLESKELEEVIETFHKKFWKSKPIVPDISTSDL